MPARRATSFWLKPWAFIRLPHGLPVDAGGLRGRDLRRSLQRRLHPGLDLHAHVAMTPRHH